MMLSPQLRLQLTMHAQKSFIMIYTCIRTLALKTIISEVFFPTILQI